MGTYITGDEFGSIAARTAIATSAGALLAKASGGDAMQGAVSAMLVHLFNYEKGRGQMGRSKLYKQKDTLSVIVIEGDIPFASEVNLMLSDPDNGEYGTPTGGDFTIGSLKKEDGSFELYSKSSVGYDAGQGGLGAVLAWDNKYPDTNMTFSMVYGVGIRLHFNNNGPSGVGFAFGWQRQGKFSELRRLWEKTNIELSTSIPIE